MILPTGKGVCIWNLPTCVNALGSEDAVVATIKELGCTWIWPKVGNGFKAWTGLESFIDKCHASGIKVGGWWFLYGNEGEYEAIIAQVQHLSLDCFAYDSESQFEASGDCAAKAKRYTSGMRALKPDLPQALCSWWKPSYHRQPMKEWLAGVDLNMPQVYPMGDTSTSGPVWRLKVCLTEYAVLGWRGPTLPIGAAFHEAGWRSTVDQINAQNQSTREAGCAGIAWWVLDQWLAEHIADFMAAVKAHDWSVGPVPAPIKVRIEYPAGVSVETVQI